MQIAYMVDQLIEPSSVNLLQNQIEKTTNQHNVNQLSTFQSSNKSKLLLGQSSHSSYKAVLQQSLTTQDKPLIYQILSQSSEEVIKNTLQQLSVSKVSALLKIIEYFLGEYKSRVDNTSQITKWLQWLLKFHLSIIVSNMQNKETIQRIRKLINKRTSQREALLRIKTKLYGEIIQKSQVKLYHPKFDYVQQQKVLKQNSQGADEQNQMDQEGMDLDGEIQDFLDEEDF